MKIYVLTEMFREMGGCDADACAYTTFDEAHAAMEKSYNCIIEDILEGEEITLEELEDDYTVDCYCDTWCARIDAYGLDITWRLNSQDLEVTI